MSIECLVDSKPVEGVKQGENLRYISSILKKRMYSKFISNSMLHNKYKDKHEIVIRNFVKGLVSTPPLFNLPPSAFTNNQKVIEFLKGYKQDVQINPERVSMYKGRTVSLGKIQKTRESEEFI